MSQSTRAAALQLQPARLAQMRNRIWASAAMLRDLPWRDERDPWAILVAETMLQQTQVGRVIPKWEAFVTRWPTPAVCALDPVGQVITAWDGLGYNRRAVNLHRAATVIADDHDGVVPDTLAALMQLPGVGPYTARAVLVFAFEQPEAVVDSNIARVLSRALVGESMGRNALQQVADLLVDPADPWTHNQVLMEIGALHCRKRRPDCATCPLADLCVWQVDGGHDPSVDTAGVANRQSTFAGSDRQGRGRLVAALRKGPVQRAAVASLTGWTDDERIDAMVRGVLDDGLAVTDGDLLRLPGD